MVNIQYNNPSWQTLTPINGGNPVKLLSGRAPQVEMRWFPAVLSVDTEQHAATAASLGGFKPVIGPLSNQRSCPSPPPTGERSSHSPLGVTLQEGLMLPSYKDRQGDGERERA